MRTPLLQLQRRSIRNIQTAKRRCKSDPSPVTVTYEIFFKLRVCFFVITNRKPYAKNRLVTSPMTSGDPKRSKTPNRKWFDLLRSPEVNKFCTVWKAVYDFLSVNSTNFVAISHRLRDMSGQSPKIHSPPGGSGGSQHFQKIASGSL